jgi:predicted NBD/HSP70 family sugar kinase
VVELRADIGTPVRQGSLREHNLALVLRHVVASRRTISRADIAATTGLTRATVSALVDELVAGRLLTEVAPTPRAGAGRPATGLALSTEGPAGLGLEVNVDYLAACVVDLTGAVRHRTVHRADQRPRRPARVLTDLARLADAATADADRQGLTVAGGTLAVPGLVGDGGVVLFAPNLGWRGVPAGESLAASRGLAVGVDNEANLAALGELHTGSERSFIYVSGEIGIGAGVVLDGALLRGARGWSGEIGHVAVRPDGPECRCGARGCLEQYAGEEAILAAARLPGGPSGQRAIVELAGAAGAGRPSALTALDDAATALGVVLAGMVNLLDVDTVVLGGVYAPLAPWLLPGVEREIAGRVLTSRWSPVRVRASALGGDAAVVGAAGSVVRAILDRPARWLAAARPPR